MKLIACPKCGKSYCAPERALPKKLRCGDCGHGFLAVQSDDSASTANSGDDLEHVSRVSAAVREPSDLIRKCQSMGMDTQETLCSLVGKMQVLKSCVRQVAIVSILMLPMLTGCRRGQISEFEHERKNTVMRTTDQAVLAKLATDDVDSGVRKEAARRITDQAVLAKLAIDDVDRSVRRAAMETWLGNAEEEKVKLIKLAMSNPEQKVGLDAVQQLASDAESLAIVARHAPPFATGDQFLVSPAILLASLNLVLLDPHVNAYMKEASFSIELSKRTQQYGINQKRGSRQPPMALARRTGVAVDITFSVDNRRRFTRTFAPEFPNTMPLSFGMSHSRRVRERLLRVQPRVDLASVIDVLFEQPEFIDQSVLTKVALEGEVSIVRELAVNAITDQDVLAKVAMEDEVSFVRAAARIRLTELR